MLLLLVLVLLSNTVRVEGACKTIGSVYDCSNSGLTSLPDFTSIPSPGSITTVNLNNNILRNISAHAFNGLTHKDLEINLDQNRITSIQDGAFDAVYDTLTKLTLRNNNLTDLSHAQDIGKLNKLSYLDLKENDFPDGTTLDRGPTDNVFRLIGDSITEFHFGGKNIATWPRVALTHFPKLNTLNYEGGYLANIPYDGFHGFEHTLEKLHISHTQLRQIPLAISQLTQLQELYFDDNVFVHDSGIFAQAFATLTHTTSPLRVLSLQNDGLSRFPAVLRNLVNLKDLNMGRNSLWYVADDALSLLINASITKMGLSGCHLDRIPQALLKLPSMAELDVSNNNIQSIERYDMSNQTTITHLNVSHNPLAYISTEAFQSLPKLGVIDFSSTAMTQIPRAILNTPALTTLDLSHCLIECTCDLTWILNSRLPAKTFLGTCETIEQPVETYIQSRVPTCPKRR
ncbi:leucine-rich repeat-containing G-protein coupled receptor 5-like [Mytilus trossulus]|uniref:leucine-rich repeat-containing G-protein coupled receptor 5-like n=1 Tax=Mytilus trossulus TaxID=6551 RepID=UPI003004378A